MKKLTTRLSTIAMMLLLLTSCNKDDAPIPDPDSSAKYALMTSVAGSTFSYNFYLQGIESLEAKTKYDNQNATEILSETIAGVFQNDGAIFTNQFGAPQAISKWTYNQDIGFKNAGSISLTELGNQGNICFKDKNTAFVGGPSSNKIMIFNPETMQKTGAIDLSSISRIGEVTDFPEAGKKINIQAPTEMIISGNHLFIGYFLLNSMSPEIPASPTADMVVIDLNKVDATSSNNSEAIVKWISSNKGNSIGSWNSGSGVQFMIEDKNNDIYILCHNYWGSTRAFINMPACILRIKSGETDFDPDYYFDIETASRGTGNPVLNFKYAGNGEFFAASYDVTAIDPDNPYSYYVDPIAQWYKFNLSNKSAQKVSDEYTMGSLASGVFIENGKAYISYKNKTESHVKEVDIKTLENKKLFTTAGSSRIFKLK